MWLKIREFAKEARCSEKTVRRLVSHGVIQARIVNPVAKKKHYRIHEDELDKYLSGTVTDEPLYVPSKRFG